ncbi:MAG: phage portal protein [Janthinobacterium lividum]
MDLGAVVERIWDKLAGVEAEATGAGTGERKTSALPMGMGLGSGSGLGPLLLPFRSGGVTNTLPKPTTGNLRRLAEMPAARRAINCIKDRIASMDWRIEARPGAVLADAADQAERAAALTEAFSIPNETDSFRTLIEPVIEDILVGGFGAVEVETGDQSVPVRLYPVDGATIQVNPEWDDNPETPRYAQVTGKIGAEGRTFLLDRELMYLKLNPRSHTIFGLGKMEVAFESINNFLGAHRYASRLASNGTVQYALWLQDRTPEQHERLTRWWQDEVEGSGRTPVLSSETPPQVIRLAAGNDAELRPEWQQLLLTMIANAFDLPPMMLGVTGDVNKSTAGEMADEAFQNAVVPLAKLIADHLTRDVIVKRLGWKDLRFVWSELESRDEATEVSIQMQLLKAGVLTVDEVRAMRGLAARVTVQV